MLAEQRKARQVVIEAHTFGPARGSMASATFATQLAGMRVLLGVTRTALRGQLELAWRPGVAGFAPRRCVLSSQREPGHRIVVEVDRFPT